MTNKARRSLNASSEFVWNSPFPCLSSMIVVTVSSLVAGSTFMSRFSGASWMSGRSDGLSLFNISSKCSAHFLS